MIKGGCFCGLVRYEATGEPLHETNCHCSICRRTSGAAGRQGTDVEVTCRGVPDADRSEVIAGWVSVLMAMKAAVDFGVDLRNHDPERTWWNGYADN